MLSVSDVTEKDVDHECQKMAVQTLALIEHIVRKVSIINRCVCVCVCVIVLECYIKQIAELCSVYYIILD